MQMAEEEDEVEDQFSELHSQWGNTKQAKDRLRDEGTYVQEFELMVSSW